MVLCAWGELIFINNLLIQLIQCFFHYKNHEYGYNVDAQIELANIYTNWIMDSRYYTRRITVDETSGTYISFIFLDTSPCISGYRSSDPANWDPCMTEYPTCSISNTDDDFEVRRYPRHKFIFNFE